MIKSWLVFCFSAVTCNIGLAFGLPSGDLACTTSDATYYYTNSRKAKSIPYAKQNFSIQNSSKEEGEIFVKWLSSDRLTYERNPYQWPFDDQPLRIVNFDFENGIYVYIGGSELSDHANHVFSYGALVTVSIKRYWGAEKFQVTMTNPKRTGDILIVESECNWIGAK